MTQQTDGASLTTALVIGYVAGAHGIRGGLRIQQHDPDSDTLIAGRTVILRRDDEAFGSYLVVAAEPVPGKRGRCRVTLEGVTDRDRAESLRRCEVLIERRELPPLADDEFYLADAIGLPVQRERPGHEPMQTLGTVVGLTTNGAQDLFEVRWRSPSGRARTWLLPVLPQHIVELSERGVTVDLPLGMLPDALEDEA